MVIQWLGQSYFKLQSGGITVAIDPYSKDIGLNPPRFKADILLMTHGHTDHSNAGTIMGEPFTVTGPGEYEAKGVFVHGIETFHDSEKGKERGMNTMYAIEIEDITILHMGDFGEEALRSETLEEVGDIDILMIPVGGKYTIDAETAAKVVKQIEPRFVIPMHYKVPGLKFALDPLDEFIKEVGARKVEPEEKMVIKKKDIGEDGKTEIKVLTLSA